MSDGQVHASSPAQPGAPNEVEPSVEDALVRSSAAVAAGTLLSRVTGLVRIGLLAYAIGRGTLADTYNIANQTPNIVYELILGGVLSATLVPIFVDFRKDERATNAVFTVALSVLLAITALAVLAAPLIADFYTFNSADPGAERVATALIRLLLPQMVFYGLTALATAWLNAHRQFVAAAFAPVTNNVVVITMILTFVRITDGDRSDWRSVGSIAGDRGLQVLLGLGTTAGIVAMAMVLVPAMVRSGYRFRPVFEWRHRAVRRMVRLSGWTVGYVISNQVALTVVLLLAESEPGGVTAYQFAFIFFQLPHGLFAVSIMTTVTPELARHASDRDTDAFRRRFAWGLRILVLVVLPAVAFFVSTADPLVGLMRVGAFDASDVAITADTLEILALGLVAFSAYLYTLRGFYALSDTRTPFLVNAFENTMNIVLALALFPSLGVQGLALAYALAYGLAAIVAYVALERRVGGLEGAQTLKLTARAGIGAVLLGATAWSVSQALWNETPRSSVLTLLVATVLGAGVYLVAIRALRVEGSNNLLAAFGRRR